MKNWQLILIGVGALILGGFLWACIAATVINHMAGE